MAASPWLQRIACPVRSSPAMTMRGDRSQASTAAPASLQASATLPVPAPTSRIRSPGAARAASASTGATGSSARIIAAFGALVSQPARTRAVTLS